ncbi:adenylate/guanylate cyclase domain-containing protein [Muriicola jejuensis]|uniref:Adenylate/guanylate cyclase domain-containing protein n=1 Tax=Muriicola jejuensis TaxID=504488 RepID=A0A6P0UDH1_9FLAO|nr:adenylate/guanylate cyclase domain-containing protein [Muriicola jejuensis]NER11304.1 adenylate/guanylate cyclase domain-containing protein [Muriicola jejuensis]
MKSIRDIAKTYRILLFLCLCLNLGFSQNKAVSDSLLEIYEAGEFSQESEIILLRDITYSLSDPDEIIHYGELLLEQAKEADSLNLIFQGYLQLGNAYKLKGDLGLALENYFEAVVIAKEVKDQKQLGRVFIAIAGAYSSMGSTDNTIRYYQDAIQILKSEQDITNYAKAIENLGDEYLLMSKPDSALLLFKESGELFSKINYREGLAYNTGNTGLAYALLGQNELAEEKMTAAIAIMEELGIYYPIAVYLTYISDIYADKGDWDNAFEYALQSLTLAKRYGLKAEISDAYLKLSEFYERTGYTGAALKYYRNYVSFRDSVQNIKAVQQMADIQLAQKQVELDLANQRRKTQNIIAISTGIASFLFILLAVGLYRRNVYIKRTNAIIEQEKEKSEKLLLNILPEKTANELKKHGAVKADKLESVTVLFTDFLSFTTHSERTDPEQLVNSLGTYFTAFDDIIEKYGLEKIKTIGDAYMCAGGVPEPLEDHALKMVCAAFEIVEYVEKMKTKGEEGTPRFEMRVGINTGPVVAGVVGHNKFSYDIWGDTVNVAARLERMSEKGRINIGENTYTLIKDHFDCEYRGEIQVKNKGMMKMFFVLGPRVSVKEVKRSADIISS